MYYHLVVVVKYRQEVIDKDISARLRDISQTLNFEKPVTGDSFVTFTTMLNYKRQYEGKRLIKIDKFYPSSKNCSHCGKVKKLALSERTYVCGIIIDCDSTNASIHIKNEGM